MLMLKKPKLIALLALLAVSNARAEASEASACGRIAATVEAVVDFSTVVRSETPPALFGFNVPWRDFQVGFWRQGRVRPELIDLLKPFAGAGYRYPGGTPSNNFDWTQTRGPLASRRPVHADYGRRVPVEFGLAEFADFLRLVDGQAMLTANLTGIEDSTPSLEAMKPDAMTFARQVRAEFDWPCKNGASCRLQALELGNELDWPPHRLSGRAYADRANAFRSEVNSQFPGITWVAAGRTAPWEKKGEPVDEFNRTVLMAMGDGVGGLAIHPYYDGIPVPDALRYVRRYADAVNQVTPRGGVYVTEHARWPAKPIAGDWRQNWYTTTSMGGALSTSDFLLGLMPMSTVKGAHWHALSAAGPWQLVRVDPATDKLVPTALYWALRVLREGFLADVVDLRYTATNQSGYRGGYDQRLIAMSGSGTRRILGVNRGQVPLLLKVSQSAKAGPLVAEKLRWVGAESVDEQNLPEAPTRIQAKGRSISPSDQPGDAAVCVPPLSVFSLTLR